MAYGNITNVDLRNDRRGLVDIVGFSIGNAEVELNETTIKEITLGESLLTPGLQTAVTLQSSIYFPSGKNFDRFKNEPIRFSLIREYTFEGTTYNYTLAVGQSGSPQIVYRMDNRGFKPTNVAASEEFTIHACDQSLLNDAKQLVSKSWKCTNASTVVSYVLRNCAGFNGPLDIDTDDRGRDYIAENIHPFQVVAQQANMALKGGNPDYVHFMTYGWDGGNSTPFHHFKSLSTLCQGQPVETYYYSDAGTDSTGYGRSQSIISMEFPCDFDMLSDLLNGIDENGIDRNTISVVNTTTGDFDSSSQTSGCGIGQFNYKIALSNKKNYNSCNLDVEAYALRRQARMALLERDKIALRITVPWNPLLHAGKVIRVVWPNKYDNSVGTYGQGTYLISSMTHNIRLGGFSTTTMDCVTSTVGQGMT